MRAEDNEQYTLCSNQYASKNQRQKQWWEYIKFINNTHYWRMSISRSANKYDLFDVRRVIKFYKKNLKIILRNNHNYLDKSTNQTP